MALVLRKVAVTEVSSGGARETLPIDGDSVRRLTLAGRSRAQIAEKFGVTELQLVRWCQNHSVPTPSREPGRNGGAPTNAADIADRARELRRALDDAPAGDRPPLVAAPPPARYEVSAAVSAVASAPEPPPPARVDRDAAARDDGYQFFSPDLRAASEALRTRRSALESDLAALEQADRILRRVIGAEGERA